VEDLKLEKIWAPWRFEYIRNPGSGCFLCAGYRSRNARESLVLEKGPKALSIMNRFPYNNGHIMVAPARHVGQLEQLDDDEILEINRLLTRVIRALNLTLKPHGFNIGVNQGPVAGAGVADHIHFHLVPRWPGDTNFMPVLADVKVVSDALHKTYDQLLTGLAKVDKP
jgi:ATP adenylyltransferase